MYYICISTKKMNIMKRIMHENLNLDSGSPVKRKALVRDLWATASSPIPTETWFCWVARFPTCTVAIRNTMRTVPI